MSKVRKIIKRRSLRWVLVAFFIGVAPLIFSLLILRFKVDNNFEMIKLLYKYFNDGTFIIIGLTIQGSKYIDFSYSRDYDLLNNQTFSWITIPFLLNALLGVALFAFLNTFGIVVVEKNDELIINFNTKLVYSLTLLVFFTSLIHTIIMHKISLNFLRHKGDLYLPTLDGEMNCEICKKYHLNYIVYKRNKKKKFWKKEKDEVIVSNNSIIKDILDKKQINNEI